MAYRCLNHPERDAVGICVKCRKYICAECCTKIEGVNYCADCLPRARRREMKYTRSWERPAAALVTLASLLICSLLVGTCAILVPRASSGAGDERWEANFEWLETVVEALLDFREDCGRFPTDEEGLEMLLADYCDELPGWNGPYLDLQEITEQGDIKDVYGTSLKYRYYSLEIPVIVSAGADCLFQTDIHEFTHGESNNSGDDEIMWVR